MAVDASVTGTAVVILGPDGFMLRQEFKTKPADWEKTIEGRMARYDNIAEAVAGLARKHYPERLLIEDYAYNAKGSGVTLGEFGGVLRKAIVGYFDDAVEVPPSVIKKFVTGKGNAGKPAVVSAVATRYGLAVATDNEADAFALAKLGAVVAGYEQAQTKFQREAAATVTALLKAV